MKTLILMRHTKSDWSTPGEADRERPLNARGQRAAALMGAWLANEGHAPDAAFVSSAVRTRETWARMAGQFDPAPEPRFRDDLYLCDPETILAAIRAAAPDCERLLVLGHNPGMASAMGRVSKKPQRLDAPTGATAIFQLPIDAWRDAAYGTGLLLAHEVPKSLV